MVLGQVAKAGVGSADRRKRVFDPLTGALD